MYVTRTHHHEVDRIDGGGVLTRIAGGGNSSADDIPVLQAYLEPSGLAFDPSGHLWIADLGGHIREVKNGKIHNEVGTGNPTFNGDALPAGSADLNQPQGIAFDALGNLYIVDKGNNRIRKVTANLFLTTIAGNGTQGFGGDGGPATNAALDLPFDVTVDSTGVVYVADTFNHRVRAIDNNGKISTLAGTGAASYSGDGGNPAQATLNTPYGVTVQADGSVVIADSFNSRVRRVTRHYLVGTVPTLGTVPPTLGTIHPSAIPTTQPLTTVVGGIDPEAPVARG